MKKSLATLLSGFMLVGSLFAFGCGSAKSDVIKVGVAVPLTGASAEDGNAIKNGVNLAVKEINAKGGINNKKVELVVAGQECPGYRRSFQQLLHAGSCSYL